jgi:Tfp pilus assembly protein PilF
MDAQPLLGKLNTRVGMAAVLAVVALFSAALYLPTTRYDFVWDDAALITQNSSLIHARPAEILARGFWAGSPQGMSGPSASYYRPLVTLSFSLNLSGSRADPWWFHRVNVILYALAAVAVTLVLWELLHSGAWALLGGLLFAAHSSHVESVAFVSGRTDILLTLFISIAAFALLRSLRKRSRWWWLAVPPAFGCALLSKETAVLFPLLVALAPLLVGVRYDRRYWLLVLAVLTVLGGYFLLRAGAVPALIPFDTQISLPSRLAAAADTFGLYVRTFFWPSPHRAWNEAGGAPLIQAPNMIATALLIASALLFALRRRFRPTLWGYAWTVVFLLPVTSVATIGPTAAERLLMLPSAGLVMVLITALARLTDFRARTRGVAAVGCGIAIVLLGADTLVRSRIWRNDETLFTAMVREAPTAPSAYIGLGDAIAEQQPDSALALYQHALRLDQDNVHARLNAAIILSDKGDQRGAIAYLRSARALEPNSDIVLNNLALAFRDAGEIDSALVAIDRSIAVNPHGTPALHLNRASVLMTAGRVAEAAEEYRRALAQDSTLAGARPELADILQKRGQYDSAIVLMQSEVAYRPAAASYAMLGDLFISTGDSARAWDSYRQALRADQSYVPALYNLAVMSAARGNLAEAKFLAERAYRLQPDLKAVRELHFRLTRRPDSDP